MYDRKVAIIKNKKCYMSPDYVRKIFSTYRGRNKLNINNNDIFTRKELSQYIDVSKEHPIMLYNKEKKRDINMENQIKKELDENYGYLNNTALKNNLLKFYSLNSSNENIKKIKQVRNKLRMNYNRVFQSLDTDKRRIQINYSDKLRKSHKPLIIKKKEDKKVTNTNKIFNKRANSCKTSLDKNRLVAKEYIRKLMNNKNKKINNIIERKKEYLDMNNISYQNINIIENEKNNETEKKRKVKIFKDGKYIKPLKKEHKNTNINERKSKKVKNMIDVDGMEYINKIMEIIKTPKINKDN